MLAFVLGVTLHYCITATALHYFVVERASARGVRSRISRTFRVSDSGVIGFGRKAISEFSA
jgi:hypothetical protein